jgi:hypothetical protein
MKTCSKCKEELSLDMFSKNRTTKDGLSGWCKLCKKEWKHSDSGKESQPLWAKDNLSKGSRQGVAI